MTRDEAAARALPAIGEDARVLLALRLASPAAAADMSASAGGTPPRSPRLAPSLSPSSSSRASSVSSSSSSLLGSTHRLQRRGSRRDGAVASPQPVCIAYTSSGEVRPLRRRFLSSDVALKPAGATANLSGGRFLSPLTRLHASSSTSSLSLRRWVTAKASAVRGGITRSLSLNRYPSAAGDGVPTAGPWDDGVFEPERPRTRSENFLNLVKRSHMHLNRLDLFPVEGGADEEEDSDLSDDDGSNSSVSSSMDDGENAEDVANVGRQPRELSTKEQQEKLEKLHNLQRLLQEGFITVTEYKDRHVQLVGEASAVSEPSMPRESG